MILILILDLNHLLDLNHIFLIEQKHQFLDSNAYFHDSILQRSDWNLQSCDLTP